MHFLQEAAINFVHKLEEVDTALVVQFNESVKGSAEFTGDVRPPGAVRGRRCRPGAAPASTTPSTTASTASRTSPGARPSSSSPTARTPPASMKEQEVIDYARAVEATVYTHRHPRRDGPRRRAARGASCARSRRRRAAQFFFPGQGRRPDQGLHGDLRRAAQPLPAGLLAQARARRHLARDRGAPASARTPRCACARATSR